MKYAKIIIIYKTTNTTATSGAEARAARGPRPDPRVRSQTGALRANLSSTIRFSSKK